jgi:hypothetical protein
MENEPSSGNSPGTSPALLKSLFALLAVLVLASMGYALWIVVEYWDRVGV